MGHNDGPVATEDLIDNRKIDLHGRADGNLVAQGMRQLKAGTTARRHPQCTLFEAERPPKLDQGSLEDGVPVERAPDLMGEHPDMPPGLLLGAYEPHLPVELVCLLLEEQLPGLDAEQVGYDVDEHEGGGAGDDGGGDLGNGHDDGNGPRVRGECPEVDEVGGAAEDDEGTELDEDPSVGEE